MSSIVLKDIKIPTLTIETTADISHSVCVADRWKDNDIFAENKTMDAADNLSDDVDIMPIRREHRHS